MVKKTGKFFRYTIIRDMLFSEVTIGTGANTVLLLFHILIFLLKHRAKRLDLAITQLALVHLVMLIATGFIATDTFGFQSWEDGLTCKLVIYVSRLMRALSICTSCLLSVLQAVTLSPRSSSLAKFKQKSSHHYPCCLGFLWVFNMLLNGRFLVSIGATPNVTSHKTLVFVSESCSQWPINYLFRYIFFSLVNIQDISCIGLMALSSGYMVSLLCRHKRQFQHLHNTCLSQNASPEVRATWTILLLMVFFMLMYILDCVSFSALTILWNNDPIHLCVQMVVGSGYATVCPFVLMTSEKRIIESLKSRWKR